MSKWGTESYMSARDLNQGKDGKTMLMCYQPSTAVMREKTVSCRPVRALRSQRSSKSPEDEHQEGAVVRPWALA